MDHGYEPSRITNLAQQSRWAVGALDGIHSTDPAATQAMAAIAGLRSAVADHLLPAADAVGIVDPLGAQGSNATAYAPPGPGAWWDRHAHQPTRFADWSDDRLFDVLADQLDWFGDVGVGDDPDHYFWYDDLPQLAKEFRRRAAIDPAFAQRLIDEAATNPMIGLVVAQGGFTDEVLAGVTIQTATGGTSGWTEGATRSLAIDELLQELETRIDAAILVYADPDAFEQLFTWNEHEHTTRPIDTTQLHAVLLAVLDEPFHRADTLTDVHLTIANVVDLADHEYFDDGFPPDLAAAVAIGIIPYLPFIIGSLNEVEGLHIRDFDGDRSTHIGTDQEIADLFGNLLRDPSTRVQIMDTIVALTITATPSSDFYTPDDVQKYIEILLDATEIEQIEESIQAAEERDRWNATIDVVFGLIDKGLEAGGKKFEAARAQLAWIKESARWLVDQIDADQIGLDGVPLDIRTMFSIGLAIAFLASFVPRNDDEEEDADEARRTLDDIRDIFAEAAATGTQVDLDDLSARVRDLEDDIEQLDDSVFAPIADVGLDPDVVVPERDADLTG